jgi:catechol 2,3-dioxygenase-like lactoylglutathione lyase family enzyme
MIDHVSIGTNDIARAREFYDSVLGCIGLRLLNSSEHSADYGVASILFSVETPIDGRPATRGNGTHVAFAVGRRELVETFHRTALARGGRDAGAPGPRLEYDAHYFAAFVFDPDGNKIEAVTRSSQ